MLPDAFHRSSQMYPSYHFLRDVSPRTMQCFHPIINSYRRIQLLPILCVSFGRAELFGVKQEVARHAK